MDTSEIEVGDLLRVTYATDGSSSSVNLLGGAVGWAVAAQSGDSVRVQWLHPVFPLLGKECPYLAHHIGDEFEVVGLDHPELPEHLIPLLVQHKLIGGELPDGEQGESE